MKRETDQACPMLSLPVRRRGLLKGAGLGAMGAGAAFVGIRPGSALADTPKRGGDLRVAILGGSAADTVDAHVEVTQPDSARVMTLYEGLVRLDAEGKLINVLAESMEVNPAATEWTVRLRKGVEFHNGRPLKAEDVIHTFRRIGDPKAPKIGATTLKQVDLDGLKALDDLTLRIPMKTPYAAFAEGISAVYFFGIVPVGYDPANPVGTGPFKYKSFTPGAQSVFTRFDNYWQQGKPYLDSLTLIDSFANETAAFNALQGGQVDVFAYAPLSLVAAASQNGAIKPMVSKPGQWTPFTMRVDQAPFSDVRVRQAFRLLVDRQQMINLSLSGYGQVASDVFSPWDPCFDASLKRERDVEKAKFLLKQAGQENMSIELVTCEIAAGVVQAAQVFAQQALDVGVTVKIRQVTSDVMYGDQYLKWTFAQDYWAYSPFLGQVPQSSLASAPFNETHWNDERYTRLYDQAQATTDAAKRCEIVREMQKIDFEEGGYIIPSFNQTVDLLAQNVQGFVPAATGLALGNFGFENVWLA
jgi:peptide/nickel transport system substrate-binding protein